MPDVELSQMQSAANKACSLMKVLSNPDRLMILCQLSKGELRVGEIEDSLDIHQPTLSQQLTVLRELDCPAVLVESVFVSNDGEANRVATAGYRQQIAEAIAAGIQAYADTLAALQPKPPAAPAVSPPSSQP